MRESVTQEFLTEARQRYVKVLLTEHGKVRLRGNPDEELQRRAALIAA